MAATDIEEAFALDELIDGRTFWLGLSSTTPTKQGTNFTEPTGGSYARVQIDGPSSALIWDDAVQGDPTTKVNGVRIEFAQATADWSGGVNQTHWGLFDAATSGNLRYFATLDVPKPFLATDTARFEPGDLRVRLGHKDDFP